MAQSRGIIFRHPLQCSGSPQRDLAMTTGSLDADGFDVDELEHAEGRALAAETGVLNAAERQRWVRLDEVVDEAHACLDVLHSDALTLGPVLGEDSAPQAVGGLVGQCDGVLLVLCLDDGNHWAEDLLVECCHSWLHVGEHGRCEECVSAVTFGDRRAHAPRKHLGACGCSLLHLRRHVLPGLRVHKRTEIYPVLLLRQFVQDLLLEGALHTLVHNGPLRSDADLPGVQHARVHYGLCGDVQVRVGENGVGIRTPQLDDGFLQ
mmetsp:Transcript_35328/g.89021  ORF Transcript_35328/g.89021 Transcript_35328/m.89021 type:complete len:263 (+) Transcript_35328:174-962(+)